MLTLSVMSGFVRKGEDEQIRKMIKDEQNKSIDLSTPAKSDAQ